MLIPLSIAINLRVTGLLTRAVPGARARRPIRNFPSGSAGKMILNCPAIPLPFNQR